MTDACAVCVGREYEETECEGDGNAGVGDGRAIDLSLHDSCQQIEINSYPDSPLFIFISTDFLPRVSSKRLN